MGERAIYQGTRFLSCAQNEVMSIQIETKDEKEIVSLHKIIGNRGYIKTYISILVFLIYITIWYLQYVTLFRVSTLSYYYIIIQN